MCINNFLILFTKTILVQDGLEANIYVAAFLILLQGVFSILESNLRPSSPTSFLPDLRHRNILSEHSLSSSISAMRLNTSVGANPHHVGDPVSFIQPVSHLH